MSKAELVKKFTQQSFSALDSVFELTSVRFQAFIFFKFLSSKNSVTKTVFENSALVGPALFVPAQSAR